VSRRGAAHRPLAALAAGRRPACRCRYRQGAAPQGQGFRPYARLVRDRRRSAIGLEFQAVSQPEIVGSLAVEVEPRGHALVEAERQAVLLAEVIAEFQTAMQHQRRAERASQGIVGNAAGAVVGAAKPEIAVEPAAVEEIPAEPGVATADAGYAVIGEA